MLLRRRLDKIEKATCVFRCPHCKGPYARREAVMTDEERAAWLVGLRRSLLDERKRLGEANPEPLLAEALNWPHCGKELPSQDVGLMVSPLEEVVAALIAAEWQHEPAA